MRSSKPRNLTREIAQARAKLTRTSEARRALPPGSSRARVTTANARWARAAEHYDRLLAELSVPGDARRAFPYKAAP